MSSKFRKLTCDMDGNICILAPCGEAAYMEKIWSGAGVFRCDKCKSVVGSIGMPFECKRLYDMAETVDRLKGRR